MDFISNSWIPIYNFFFRKTLYIIGIINRLYMIHPGTWYVKRKFKGRAQRPSLTFILLAYPDISAFIYYPLPLLREYPIYKWLYIGVGVICPVDGIEIAD